MLRIINRRNLATNAHRVADFAVLRRRVFTDRLGWHGPEASRATPRSPGQEQDATHEYDRFDTSDTIYMLMSNTSDEVVAGLRLLPANGSSLMAEMFPGLPGCGAGWPDMVYEVSRFVVDPCRIRTAGCGNLGAQMIQGLQDYSMLCGLSEYISVSFSGMEQLLRNVGCPSRRLAAPMIIGGRRFVPLAFGKGAQAVANTGEDFDVLEKTGGPPAIENAAADTTGAEPQELTLA
ncbi:acyl-homoserine-lactone synthase [Nguyenibacter vanlangensis]|uniref:Acyl-homoserine-lactone synthase n=1 Tax=Nguyenibacter vanlangensis TaxID=1216886 RepID=A0A7Y7ITX8_9PROT|nr:acyl-homoserine-lactone synthase [Nguyenibacter vanlangensis]NVN09765.1 hypothetical protein [Nguyenibacter vanlangensis]